MKTLVIGCGYVGRPLAQSLQSEGDEIAAWTYSPASARELSAFGFARVVVGSVANEALWNDLGAYDQVVHCASSGGGGPKAYREVFLEGARLMCICQPHARKLFVSSTSVYGQTDGEFVTEKSPAEPAAETSRTLREAEKVALQGGAMVVRSVGIYGPRRARLFEKAQRGEAIIEGNGSRWINQIHRDDLVSALRHLLQLGGKAGEIYNVGDGAPLTYLDYYRRVSALLDQPLPPVGPVKTKRKRGLTSKRVVIDTLRATGWEPRHSDFIAALREIKDQPAEAENYSPR